MNLSFIKLDIDILNDSKIKFIVRLPDGDKLFRFWIGLLCLAMKSARPGIIEIGDNIPFTPEMLANHFDLELTTVQLALNTFEKFKMIEVWDDGTMFITNFIKHQKLDKIEKAREVSRLSSRKYREKIKMISDGHVKKNDETDKEKEIDKDKDKEQVLLQEFDQFWNIYDKKVSKERSFNLWEKLNVKEKEEIFKVIPAYIDATPDKQYRKNPDTYLRNKSWNDEIYLKKSVKEIGNFVPESNHYLE